MNSHGMTRQRGAVIILLFVSLILTAMAVVLTALNSRNPNTIRMQNTQQELQRVKEVLLGFALTESMQYGTLGPGRLPCPDVNNTGSPQCNAVNLRRLPRSLALPLTPADPFIISEDFAATDEQFWYAITPAFKAGPGTALNTQTAGAYTIDGVGGYAAVLIAPGVPLTGQTRPHNTQAVRYLEGGNETGPDFVTGGTSADTFNDTVLGITTAEVMTMATIRVAQEIKRVLDTDYVANGNDYPVDQTAFTTAMSSPTAAAWLAADNWTVGAFAYTYVGVGMAQIKFDSCAVVFSFANGSNSISRSPKSC